MKECVEYLEHPEILVAEFADSHLTAEAWDQRDEDFHSPEDEDLPQRRSTDKVAENLLGASEIRVLGATPYSFEYVARDIVPFRARVDDASPDADRERRAAGLDYVGLIVELEPMPVLGVIQPENVHTPYHSLLRLLTGLAEVSTEAQVERANRFLFKGRLSSRPCFDLHIMKADGKPAGSAPPLAHLTKDLAHVFNTLLKEEWQFPNLLRSISYVRMSDDFDGTLDVEWCV
jgi:hypothetical protein